MIENVKHAKIVNAFLNTQTLTLLAMGDIFSVANYFVCSESIRGLEKVKFVENF